MKIRIWQAAVAAAILVNTCTWVVNADGKVVSVDVGDANKEDDGTFIGPAAAPGDVANPVWNDITYGQPMFSATDLLFTDGTDSGIDMTVVGTSPAFGGGIDWENIQPTHQENRLTRDRAFNNQPAIYTFTLTLSELNAGDTYDFYLYAGSGYTQEITVNGVTKIATSESEFDDGSLGPDHTFPTSTEWIEGDHYVVFPDITGITELAVVYAAGPAEPGYQPGTLRAAVLPGFQIVVESGGDGIPGDFDGDMNVDGEDLAQWTGDFGVDDGSDADNDNDSDGADFLIWQQHFGEGPGVAAVPEPTSLGLANLGLAITCRMRRRRD